MKRALAERAKLSLRQRRGPAPPLPPPPLPPESSSSTLSISSGSGGGFVVAAEESCMGISSTTSSYIEHCKEQQPKHLPSHSEDGSKNIKNGIIIDGNPAKNQVLAHHVVDEDGIPITAPGAARVVPPPMKIPRTERSREFSSSSSVMGNVEPMESEERDIFSGRHLPAEAQKIVDPVPSSTSPRQPIAAAAPTTKGASSLQITAALEASSVNPPTSASSSPMDVAPASVFSAQSHSIPPPEAGIPAKTTSSASSTSRKGATHARHGGNNNNSGGIHPVHATSSVHRDMLDDEAVAAADKASAFYLQHQNRALATELRSLQFAVRSLQAERDARRQHCQAACQALHSLQATWTQLETALGSSTVGAANLLIGPLLPDNMGSDTNPSPQSSIPTPGSTGSGDAVEWTVALQESLAQLGKPQIVFPCEQENPLRHVKQDENSLSVFPDAVVHDLSQISANVAARASVLQEWIWKILRHSHSGDSNSQILPSASHWDQAELRKEIATASAKARQLQHHVLELKASRDETATRERKVRRNIYRLSCGMLTVKQVMQALDFTDPAEQETMDQIKSDHERYRQLERELEQLQKEQQSSACSGGGGHDLKANDEIDGGGLGSHGVNAGPASCKQISELQTKIRDLEQISSNRERYIEELAEQLKEKETRINELCIKQQSPEDVEKLELFESTRLQLIQAESTIVDLKADLQVTRERWAQALGNEKSALAAMEEQVAKFQKRWAELTNAFDDENCENGKSHGSLDQTAKFLPLHEQLDQSKKIIQQQHKLDQAMESVRQAEATRDTLKEALSMNETLRAKLDEVKSKYVSLQASCRTNSAGARSSDVSGSAENATHATPRERDRERDRDREKEKEKDGASTNHERPSSGDLSSKYEKIHREFKKIRKELAAANLSKETAKSKVERVEKERDSLTEANARLLRQITEKDEVNARSLSTILHLKSMTEQLTLERDNLEQQAKSASQLSLAARLATNAKERVAEEILKDKSSLEERLTAFETKHTSIKSELANTSKEWSLASGKMTTMRAQLSNITQRCDELVADNESKQEEIRQLVDRAEKAQRQARDARAALARAQERSNTIGESDDTKNGSATGSSSSSAFTIDQLNTHISVLKARLACPVCHYRDKECIITRCRHMHCKKCVDDQLASRNRKCPTCNNKFSNQDVEDVWL